MNCFKLLFSAMLLTAACTELKAQTKIMVDVTAQGVEVSDQMYGIFIEDINRAIDGRLYAEMVMNRSFEDAVLPKGYHSEGDKLISPLTYNHVTGQMVTMQNRWDKCPVPGWMLAAGDSSRVQMKVEDTEPNFATAPHYLSIAGKEKSGQIVLTNSGYGGFALKEGEEYNLRVIVRSTQANMPLMVRVADEQGAIVTATQLTVTDAGTWTDLRASLKALATTTTGQLQLVLPETWTGTLDLDYVSLMPDNTYHHRPNGLRPDVAEAIAGLKPAFVRWPGGCVVEGITLETSFHWKETIGDPAARPGAYNLWGYRNTCGFGWKEALDFCEDLNAAAMYVCNVGMACQAQTSELSPESELDDYLNDCFDAIEYAIGDTTSIWGARRAAEGHPAPYRLEYVEIGNENWGPEYDKRYAYFHNAISARYPQLHIISNYGIDVLGDGKKLEYIDPHWYVSPQFFFNNASLFDSLPRTGTSIYVGEYACNRSVGSGNMEAALSEAAFMLGMERNADLVRMCSYAPLLESDWYRAWPTNLIWLSQTQAMGRSSYHVQKMMAENKPSRSLPISLTASKPERISYPTGRLGLGCWKSKVEFRQARLTLGDGIAEPLALDNGEQYVGEWTCTDGTLRQEADAPRCKYLLPKLDADTYTLELQARKCEGKDAFIVYFGMDDDGQEGYYYSVGGQNNSKACVERMYNGENTGQDGDITEFRAETDQWYDLRIEVTPHESRLYVDGNLMITHHPLTYAQQAYAAGYDDATGELVLKAVNAASKPQTISYHINGKLAAKGTAITLRASSLADENSFDQPDLISPKTSTFKPKKQSINYTLPPYSFTVLRVPVRK